MEGFFFSIFGWDNVLIMLVLNRFFICTRDCVCVVLDCNDVRHEFYLIEALGPMDKK